MDLIDFGKLTVEMVLTVAGLLKYEAAPGVVALGLVAALFISFGWFGWAIWRAIDAIKTIRDRITAAKDETEFAQKYVSICSDISQLHKNNYQQRLSRAWGEFQETIIEPDIKDGSQSVQNTCRPNVFFNREDLHLEHGFWKYLPNLFVSLGLFLTFLGLISALNEASGALASEGSQQALEDLLKVATAKFIMSLTGLACSILFSIRFRIGNGRIDKALIELCEAIEERLHFISSESLQKQQLDALVEQKGILQTFSNDLVAQVARPLREELPQTIKTSISEAIAPVAEGIKKSSTDGVGELVNSISDRLAGGFEDSLNTVNQTLITVGSNLEAISSRLDTSSGRMGTEIDAAAQRLSDSIETLQEMMSQTSKSASDIMQDGADSLLESMNNALKDIQENTAEGSRRLEEAAGKISAAAEAFNEAMSEVTASASINMRQKLEGVSQDVAAGISSAGSSVASSMTDAVKLLTEEADQFSNTMNQKLTAPLEELSRVMRGLNNSISDNSEKISDYSGAIGRSTEATTAANDLLVTSVDVVLTAVEPIHNSVSQTERAATQMSRSINDASTALISGVEKSNAATVTALENVNETFSQSRHSVDQSLQGLNIAISKFGDIVERYDDIDEKLGDAFRTIETAVKGTVDEIDKFSKEIHDQYSNALAKLQELVDALYQFEPPKE